MIIVHEQLDQYQGKVAMVDGVFDPFHAGHLAYFRAAEELGVPVIAVVACDSYVAEKKHPPLLAAESRGAIIDAFKPISLVYVRCDGETTADVLRTLRPRYYVKGNEWSGKLSEEETVICKDHGIEIVFTDTKINSSSDILHDFAYRAGVAASVRDLARFEDLFFRQQAVSASHYEESYFLGNWREGENDYRIKTRREREGRGPALIKQTFAPEKTLDIGCGPGAMMYLLQEQGVIADGVDVSPTSKSLAPEEVRERIIVADVTAPDLPIAPGAYDLVICREVLEHMTVRQILQTVATMCRISSRFVYVTTRFHQRPATLLSVGEDTETDPTHITVFQQDFLRLLFVMQGFARRQDLETTMDWLDKRRVLVYEKRR